MSAAPLKMYVEYCGACGYEAKYLQLKSLIEERLGGQVEVGGDSGRSSSFEITLQNPSTGQEAQIFSKIRSGSFPDAESVCQAVQQFAREGTVKPIDQAQGGGCSVQ